MRSRANPFRAFPILLAFFLNVVIGPLAPLTQFATQPVLALGSSTFDALDGNLVDDDGASTNETDWCTPVPNRAVGLDSGSGANDTSFASNNNKEDHNVPTLSTGTIPNNKDDLLREYVASETVNGDLFVYLAWIRADSTGTSTIDFEFNQSDEVSSNGKTKVRTEGDLLVTFDFQANPGAQGGYSVELTLRTWDDDATDNPDPTSSPANTGKWVNPVNLITSGLAEGSVNAGTVSDCVASPAVNLPVAQFGEAVLDLSQILGDDCTAFGSIFTKSRSSNSFSADMKDRIDPLPFELSTCGQITILKDDENGDPLGGATFTIEPDPFGGSDPLVVKDNESPDDNDVAGVIHLSDVEPGEYEVCETTAPAGYIIDTECQTLTVAENGSAEFGPFVNGLGDISWVKKDDETGLKLCCATFTLEGIAGAADGFGPITVVDNGQNDEDADAGELLVSDLLLGTYRITETVAPTGYDLPDPAFKDVVLSGQTGSPEFAFRDPPHPVLEVVKNPDGGHATAGDQASFMIKTTNKGPGTSLGTTLSDPLPAVANGWSVDSEDWAGDCAITGDAGDPQTLSCGPEDLAVDAFRTVTVTTTVTDEDCHKLENLATASASNADDASDAGDIDVLCADIRIEKTPDEAQDGSANDIVAGDDAIFTMTVFNDGDGEARGVMLFDDLPGIGWAVDAGNTTLTDCAVTDPTTGPWAALGEVLSCGPDTIAAEASARVTVVKTTTPNDCGTIDNSASVTTSNDGADSDNGEIDVLCPDVGVTKTADNSPINAGDDAEYTITVTAGGTGTSENVSLHDDLPAVDGVWSEDHPDCSISGLDLDCDFGSMNPGDSEAVHLSHTTTADDCGTLLNDVSVSADGDVNPANDTVLDVPIEVECPDVQVEKTGSGTVNATDAIFFEITVSNIGDGDAYGFSFTDTLPDVQNGWTLASFDNPPASCDLNGLALSCSVEDGTFLAGDSFTVRLEADSEVADCGALMNTASASASNEAIDEEDPILDNNADGHTIVVLCPDLDAKKLPDDSVVSAGQPIGFTISVENSGAAGTGTAYDVELDDLLPFKAGGSVDWEIDPAYAGPGICEITGAVGSQVLHCDFGDLESGDSASVHVVSDTTKADCQLYRNVGDITSTNHEELNPSADTTVECPGLNIIKRQVDANGDPTTDPIVAGETAYFEVIVWNAGPGTALNATFHDELPSDVTWSLELLDPDNDDSCNVASSAVPGQPEAWSADCSFGDLPPSSMEDGKHLIFSGETDRDDCGLLVNNASAEADNNDEVTASASIVVRCPTVEIVKVNDRPDPVLPGTLVHYTLTVTVGDGPADDVVVHDMLPEGLDAPSDISDGGLYDAASRTITWNLDDLDSGSYVLTYQAAVSLDAEQGDELVNLAVVTSPTSQCPDLENLADECDDDSIVTVRVPELVIDKSADTEEVHFVFDADGNVLSVDPEQVTWTLTYTLSHGPVTDAVITDPLPQFLVFVSASDGGVYDPATGIITWELGDLTVDGSDSVSFMTTVDPEAPEGPAILNVATIDSNETAPDDGEDSIIVTSESELGGNPTPKPSVPNTAVAFGPAGDAISIPVELLAFLLIGSLGTLAYANVRSARRRR